MVIDSYLRILYLLLNNLNLIVMKIKLIQKANPTNRDEKKWYANAVNAGTKDLKAISKVIAGRSSLTSGDIQNVLQNFVDELPTLLMDGFSLQLGGFGTLRLSLSSTGSVTEAAFDTHTIKSKVVFTPGHEIKHDLDDTHYERTAKESGGTPPVDPDDDGVIEV